MNKFTALSVAYSSSLWYFQLLFVTIITIHILCFVGRYNVDQPAALPCLWHIKISRGCATMASIFRPLPRIWNVVIEIWMPSTWYWHDMDLIDQGIKLYWILYKRQTVGISELKCKIFRHLIYKDTTSNWPIPDQWFIYHSIYKSVKFIDFPLACHYNKNCWPNELVWLCMFLTEDAEVKHQQNQNKPFVRVQRLTSPLNNRKSSHVHPLRIHSRKCT